MSTLNLCYLTGFGNQFESEAEPRALIKGCNSPQQVPYGLYAEQLSGSAFTAPRSENLRSWLYRIRPSVLHHEFKPVTQTNINNDWHDARTTPPNQMRWDPIPFPDRPTNFVEGLLTFAGNDGAAILLYAANASMQDTFFYNADGDLLIVPQAGKLRVRTEFGLMEVAPKEIVVIPRGIKFQVELLQREARGYVCENYGAPFRLPNLGVIGSNGLANPRDFEVPTAHYREASGEFTLFCKFNHQLWCCPLDHHPLDVVAWHGNYVPYKYNLQLFNTINTVSYDHADPSIFTVLTSPSMQPGTANVDFVIFPPRWMVAENTFRPPYYHRNLMSEFMGLIDGQYDAKTEGFVPGGASLHNGMSAHGPDAVCYEQAVASKLQPEYYEETLAFMFESRSHWYLTKFAYNSTYRQKDYQSCWRGLKARFKAPLPA